jgi:hypothetical protein
MCTSLGFDLAKKLEVDAILVVWILSFKTEKSKENYGVRAISGYMFGPNPIQRPEGEDETLSYARGIFYVVNVPIFTECFLTRMQKNFRKQISQELIMQCWALPTN